MSTTVDHRVVEMQFDNRNFEKNVATSLSTLDKLKQKLNFSGAAKGLENIDAAAKKVDVSGLGTAVETVSTKFSALQVVGVTALANLTNSAVNAGKNIVKALTIDPVKMGFSEYETKINAVQTILSNTSSKGTTMSDITKALDELNAYADKTIYNFAEMTRNIGTFTAAGVDLENSVASIQGIANLAAASGSTSQQASTAMYQLSQALASGTVKLMDWNSVVNAGMGGEKFQEALKATAREYGVGVDAIIEKNGSFRESLHEGWLSADILNDTLKKFTVEGAKEYAQAMLDSGKYTQEQADALIAEAQSMQDAATKVKTFTQLIDTLKESLQSGWAKTWELLFGDFEEARRFFSSVSDTLGGAIESISNARNNLIAKAFGSKWDTFAEKIEKAGVSVEDFESKLGEVAKKNGVNLDKMIKKYGSLKGAIDNGKISSKLIIQTLKEMAGAQGDANKSTEDMTEKLKHFQKVVDEVWQGDFKNGKERINALTEAGYDYAEVQSLVNKTVDGHKLTLEDLSDAQLKSVGYTEEEISKLRKLAEQAEKTGTPLNDLIKDLEKPTGRVLFFDSISNVIEAIAKPLGAIREAWNATFGEMFTSDTLYNVIEGINKFTESLIMSDDAAENFKKICEGVFSIFQLMTGVVTRSLTTGLKILGAVLNLFGTNLLDFGAAVADIIIKIRDWVKENTMIIGAVDKIAEILYVLINGIAKCVDEFIHLEQVQGIITDIKEAIVRILKPFKDFIGGFSGKGAIQGFADALENALTAFQNWIKSLDSSNTFLTKGREIINGLILGIEGGIGDAIDIIAGVAQKLIDAFCSVLGINSPSKVFIALGGFLIAGLIIGLAKFSPEVFEAVKQIGLNIINIIGDLLQNGLPALYDFVKTFGSKIFNAVKTMEIDFGAIFVAGVIVTLLLFLKKALDIADKLVSPLGAIKGTFEALTDVFKNTAKFIKARTMTVYADALFTVAKAIFLVAASVALLSKMDTASVWSSIGAIAALSLILAGFMVLGSKINMADGFSFGKMSLMMLALATSVLIMASAMKKLEGVDPGRVGDVMKQMALLLGGMTIIVGLLSVLSRGFSGRNAAKIGVMFLGMAIAINIIAKTMKNLAEIPKEEVGKGIKILGGLMTIMALFMALSLFSGLNAAKAGVMFIGLAVAVGILARVIKQFAEMNAEDINKGLYVIGYISVLFASLMALSKFAGVNAAKAGVMFLGIGVAVTMLAYALKQFSKMHEDDVNKCIKVLGYIGVVFATFMALSQLIGGNAMKAGVLFLGFGAAVAMLAVSMKILAGLSEEEVKKGLFAIGYISVAFAALMALSQLAGENAGKAGAMFLKMSIAILILVGAVALLSFLDPKDVMVGTAAISTMLILFGGIIALTGMMQPCMKTLIAMSVAIGILAASLIILARMDNKKVLAAGTAISMVLGVFAILIAATSIAKSATATILVLTLAIGAIGGMLYLLSTLPIESTLGAAKALSILLLSLSASVAILGLIPAVNPMSLVALGALVVAVGLLGVIVGLLKKYDMLPSVEQAKALSLLLLALSGACAILSVVGMTGPAALIGAAVLDGVILAIGGLLVGIGALMTHVPQAEQFLDKGIAVLEKLSHGLGSILGNFASGLIDGATSGLPEMGSRLSAFMVNIKPFLDGINSLDTSCAENAKTLADAILAITKADVLNSITSWITGGSSLTEFAAQLVPFGKAMKEYSLAVAGMDTESVTASATAGKALSELANNLPNSGGIAAWFAGENNMTDFAKQLVPFGKSLKEYSLAVAGIDSSSVTNSATAAKSLAELANNLPNSGGVAAWFAGENNLGDFAKQLVPFGKAIKQYSTAVIGVDADSIKNSTTAAKHIVKLADILPNTGGVAAFFAGDNTLGGFAKELVSFGRCLKNYSNAVAGTSIEAINNSVTAAKKIVGLINSTASINTSGVKAFKNAVSDLGKVEVNGFISAFSGASASMSKIGTDITSYISKGMRGGQAGLKTLSTSMADMIVKAFDSRKGQMTKTGSDLVTALAKGMDNSKGKAKTAMSNAAKTASSGASSYSSAFYQAGADMVTGFANGINSYAFKARIAATAMANAAADAAKKALDEHSPSRVFYGIGEFAGMGLVNALVDYGKKAYNAGVGIAAKARDGLQTAISTVYDLVTGDMDMRPTIRPVVDLSDVRAGVGSIGSMFDGTSFGVSTKVDAISSMMNRYNQNGGNDDVVSAIDKLSKRLDNVGGNNYTINGVTYDDGSRIQAAFGEVIRQARIERRV